MEYQVTGSRGDKYIVTYDENEEYYSCTCPDFEYRCKDNNMMCKHIMKVKEIDDTYREELAKAGIIITKQEQDVITKSRDSLMEAKSKMKDLAIFLMTAYNHMDEK